QTAPRYPATRFAQFNGLLMGFVPRGSVVSSRQHNDPVMTSIFPISGRYCRAAAQGDDSADDRQCAWAATVNTAARTLPPILASRSARRLGRCHSAE